MDHRLKLFAKFTVPSLLSQTCQNWSWVIRVDVDTPEEDLESIAESVDGRASITTDDWDVVVSSICSDIAVPLITTRIDNDDMLCHTALEKVRDTAKQQNNRCVINMPSGYGYDADNRRLYLHDGFFDSISPFVSLLELTPPFEGIHKYTNREELNGLFPVINIDGRCWVEVCHRMNVKNSVYDLGGEVRFEELQNFW
jgi:hypothetical protein